MKQRNRLCQLLKRFRKGNINIHKEKYLWKFAYHLDKVAQAYPHRHNVGSGSKWRLFYQKQSNRRYIKWHIKQIREMEFGKEYIDFYLT